jgi:hypothetical protein
VLLKGRVIFRQYITKKHKRFGIKIYDLCDFLGYEYDMTIYLGKQRQLAKEEIKSTHGIVLQLIRRVVGLEHKIYGVIMNSEVTQFIFAYSLNKCLLHIV